MKRNVLLAVLSLLLSAALSAQTPSATTVNIGGKLYRIHDVAKGETLYSIARLYGVSEKLLREENPSLEQGLRAGERLRIPAGQSTGKGLGTPLFSRKQGRQFQSHTVNQGETLYSISKRYGISINTIIEDNPGIDPTSLAVGQELMLRRKSMGDASQAQIMREWEEYRNSLEQRQDGYVYHIVERGETLYGLSKRFGVSVEQIEAANNLGGSVRAGSIIRIPDAAELQTVQVEETGPDESLTAAPFGGFHRESAAVADPLPWNRPVEVALMLPLRDAGGRVNGGMADFYKGVLIGLQEMKAAGVEVRLNLYNTARSPERVREIVSGRDFNPDLIIGPVYQEELDAVVGFAEREHVAVVSPLAALDSLHSGVVWQMAPDEETKYDKMRPLFAGDKNIVLLYTDRTDRNFENRIKELLPGTGYGTYTVRRGEKVDALADMLSSDRENVFVVLSSDALGVDQALAALSSVNNNLVARSIKRANITVVGNSSWSRYRNIDRNLFFKLKVCLVSSYHADRSNDRVKEFDRRYVKDFGSLPSLYSYRGYDAVKLFIGSAQADGRTFERQVERLASSPGLQTPYRFGQESPSESHRNREWVLVRYLDNYTIAIE